MERGMNKIVIVTRKTRLKEMIYKYNTVEQAKFYIEHLGADFSDYEKEDIIYEEAVRKAINVSEKYGRTQVLDREFVPNMIFGEKDIVIAIGQDGLVANVMKYLNNQPLIGINPDIKRWEGILVPFETGEIEKILQNILKEKYNTKEVTMIKAETKDGQRLYGVNDVFIGQKTHTSARYDLTVNTYTENQSSSGIIISTGLGSTGWYKSIITEAEKIAKAFGTKGIEYKKIGWAEDLLLYTVREPYPSKFTQAELVYGTIGRKDNFVITSKMPENGVAFSDGMENDFISFNAGAEIRIEIAERKGKLVV